jgi:hypothetical protein
LGKVIFNLAVFIYTSFTYYNTLIRTSYQTIGRAALPSFA